MIKNKQLVRAEFKNNIVNLVLETVNIGDFVFREEDIIYRIGEVGKAFQEFWYDENAVLPFGETTEVVFEKKGVGIFLLISKELFDENVPLGATPKVLKYNNKYYNIKYWG